MRYVAVHELKYKVPQLWELRLPKGALLLSFQNVGGTPLLTVLVEDTNEPETRTLAVVGTGRDFPGESPVYVGSFYSGLITLHLFEVFEVKA